MFFDLRILITLVSDYPSGSFDYVGVCPSNYGFWLHLCLITPLALLTMLVCVLRFTDSDCTCVWLSLWLFWLCWCLSFDLRILITLVADYPSVLLAMLVSVLRFTVSDYTCVWLPLWLFCLCWCLSFDLRILITPVSDYPSGSFGYVGSKDRHQHSQINQRDNQTQV
jgi:hypothetical protein